MSTHHSTTKDNFEQLISVLDETRGVLVYIYHDGHNSDEDDLGFVGNDISCDGIHFEELAKKAKNAMNTAKFSLRLACSPKYIVYEGVWSSCKEDPNQFKEDLRYLFTLLERGSLKPNIARCIDLEEVSEVQDTIELLGKQGTIVCLPTALYEKKACHVVPPEISLKKDETGFLVLRDAHAAFGAENIADFDYAVDAGYGTAAQHGDTLSDFHRMREKQLSFEEEATCHSSPYFPSSSDRVEYNFGGYSLDEQDKTSHYQAPVSSVSGFVTEGNAPQIASATQPSVTNNTHRIYSSQHRGKTSRRYKSYKSYQQQRRQHTPSQHGRASEPNETREVIVSSPSDERNDARKQRREARKCKQSNAEEIIGRVMPSQAATATVIEQLQITKEVNNIDIAAADDDGALSIRFTTTLTPEMSSQSLGNPQKLQSARPSWKNEREENEVHTDTRNEYNIREEETSMSSNDASSFYMIMNKWKNSDDLSRQSEKMVSNSGRRKLV